MIADDGANLYIDGKKIIDNDGRHSAKAEQNSIFLSEGKHDFRVNYFQGPRFNMALELRWKAPGDWFFSYIPTRYLMRPDSDK